MYFIEGVKAAEPGKPLGHGLTREAAEQMGLWEGCPVGCSLIDAHAGGLGNRPSLNLLSKRVSSGFYSKSMNTSCPAPTTGTHCFGVTQVNFWEKPN